MTRTYSPLVNQVADNLLRQIADRTTAPVAYQSAMLNLGYVLGDALLTQIEPNPDKVCLATTVEDADFLAQGILERLEARLGSVAFACFSNHRTTPFGVDALATAPILKQYQEPADDIDVLIIVKSIISGACVVKTNLRHLIQKIQPAKILIAAPVMYEKAEASLRREFEPAITDKFQFFYLAQDSDRTPEGEVIPGIGGMIYDRLGFDGQAAKNEYVPKIVKARRARFQHSVVD
ncbi:hypothetical protein BST81_23200 [Leptolyngbya sp. 'hensonii']|uniref:hypothetical protein n=1 Tax=Leptolyngbya sp. 'hensonii' TaxID=1922337 RepID=UPI00094FD132|nr:hypothetical protein [Leptolyngbya sp. 'hensonii']OLP15972.1 hypothetical protein BST81_23200 [Leptolyngbya sp. 'hensonii']